jgi:hypothetical protein
MRVAGIDSSNNQPGRAVHLSAEYLGEQAQHCVALARACPDRPTSQALEALGVELMERAAEVEESTKILSPGYAGEH